MIEDREIDIKDCLRYILLQWRLIIIGMVIGALLLDCVGIIKSKKVANEVQELNASMEKDAELETENQAILSELETKLTDREKEEVNNAVMSYKTYRANYSRAAAYMKNSIRMRINPSCVPTMTANYSVDNHYEVIFPKISDRDSTADIVDAFCNALVTDELLDKICDTLGGKLDAPYIEELITISKSTNSSATLTLTVIADEKEKCETIFELIVDQIENITPDIKAVYGDFDITEYNRKYSENVDTALLTEQQTRSGTLYNYKTYFNSIVSGMTENQQTYYYALLDGTVKMDEDDTETETEIVTDPLPVPEVKVINLKYILFGMVLGFFCVFCWFALKYILSPKLHVSHEITDYYKIPVIGILKVSEQPKRFLSVIDQWIVSIFQKNLKHISNGHQMEMVCTTTQVAAERHQMKQVYLTGTCQGAKWEQIVSGLKQRMGETVGSISYGKSVMSDSDSLRKMTNADGVVFIEYVDGSRCDEIQREIEICRENNVAIIGSVVVY